MKTLLATLSLALIAQSALAAEKTKRHQGAWYAVQYPANFTVSEEIKSASAGNDAYDSARFTSPDGKVTFYVYSPQWGGEASNIALRPGEREISRESKKRKEQIGETTLILWTIEAPDGRRRSYEETRTGADGGMNWILGIEYADEASLQQYRAQYLNFKKSLEQFADGYDGEDSE